MVVGQEGVTVMNNEFIGNFLSFSKEFSKIVKSASIVKAME